MDPAWSQRERNHIRNNENNAERFFIRKWYEPRPINHLLLFIYIIYFYYIIYVRVQSSVARENENIISRTTRQLPKRSRRNDSIFLSLNVVYFFHAHHTLWNAFSRHVSSALTIVPEIHRLRFFRFSRIGFVFSTIRKLRRWICGYKIFVKIVICSFGPTYV